MLRLPRRGGSCPAQARAIQIPSWSESTSKRAELRCADDAMHFVGQLMRRQQIATPQQSGPVATTTRDVRARSVSIDIDDI
jgi:hypothetical protein